VILRDTQELRKKASGGNPLSLYIWSINKELYGVTMAGKAKILLMDDEQIILDVTNEVLAFLGYDVMFARMGGQQSTSTGARKRPVCHSISSSSTYQSRKAWAGRRQYRNCGSSTLR
jgi:hypothetical protein